MDKLVELTVKACGHTAAYNLAVAHGGAPEYLETLRQKLTAPFRHMTISGRGRLTER